MSFSQTLKKQVLQHVFGTENLTKPVVYCALFSDNPDDGGAEIVGNAYNRVLMTPMTVTVSSQNGTAENTTTFEFPVATGNWGLITHAALFDAVTGGTLLASAILTQPKNVQAGDSIRFPAGALNIYLY